MEIRKKFCLTSKRNPWQTKTNNKTVVLNSSFWVHHHKEKMKTKSRKLHREKLSKNTVEFFKNLSVLKKSSKV